VYIPLPLEVTQHTVGHVEEDEMSPGIPAPTGTYLWTAGRLYFVIIPTLLFSQSSKRNYKKIEK
jgi:hypothetical protein